MVLSPNMIEIIFWAWYFFEHGTFNLSRWNRKGLHLTARSNVLQPPRRTRRRSLTTNAGLSPPHAPPSDMHRTAPGAALLAGCVSHSTSSQSERAWLSQCWGSQGRLPGPSKKFCKISKSGMFWLWKFFNFSKIFNQDSFTVFAFFSKCPLWLF